jgi:hypothetical protein
VKSNAIRVFSGPQSIGAAERLLAAQQDRREQWPYVHVEPPPNAEDVIAVGAVATQDVTTPTSVTVVAYQVNSGKRFFLTSILMAANVPIVPNQAAFTLDRNSQDVLAINSTTQYSPEHGLINVPCQLGSNLMAPWYLNRAREFAALDVVRIKAINYGLSVGDPTYWICGLFGYEVPSVDIKLNR